MRGLCCWEGCGVGLGRGMVGRERPPPPPLPYRHAPRPQQPYNCIFRANTAAPTPRRASPHRHVSARTSSRTDTALPCDSQPAFSRHAPQSRVWFPSSSYVACVHVARRAGSSSPHTPLKPVCKSRASRWGKPCHRGRRPRPRRKAMRCAHVSNPLPPCS